MADTTLSLGGDEEERLANLLAERRAMEIREELKRIESMERVSFKTVDKPRC